MACLARVFVRGLEGGKRVLVYSTTNYLSVREALTGSLRRASEQMPGTVAEAADLHSGPLVGDEQDRSVVFLGGAVESPAPLQFAEFRAFADFVAMTLVADGFELAEPVEVREGSA